MDGGVLRQQVQTQWCFLFISNSSLWTCDSLSNILWTLSVVLWQMCREQLCSHEALRGICDHFHSLVHFHTPHFKLILTSLPLVFLVKIPVNIKSSRRFRQSFVPGNLVNIWCSFFCISTIIFSKLRILLFCCFSHLSRSWALWK